MSTRVILLIGCSGAGKSTYARDQFPGAVVVSADHYFEALAARTDQTFAAVWNLWDLRTAHKQCEENFLAALAKQAPVVIVDNTNVRPADQRRFAKMGRSYGCETELHVFSPWVAGAPVPTEDQIQRYVTLCHGRNGHGVPLDTVAQQFSKVDLPAGIYLAGKPAQYLRPLPTLEPT